MSMAYVQPSTKAPGNNPKKWGQVRRRRTRKENDEKSMGGTQTEPSHYLYTPKDSRFPKKRPQGERASECKDTQDKRNEEVSGTEMGDGFNPHSSENIAKTTGRYHEKRKVVTGLFPRDTNSSTESSRGKKKKGAKRSE
jgi:hypothetical protein